MATRAERDDRSAWARQARMTAAMALVFAAGFSFQLAMGRSSFEAPPVVHAHALIFFGWVVLALVQSGLAASGRLDLHRRLGWLGAAWLLAMLVVGPAVTVNAVRMARSPFFFQPQAFLFDDVASLLCFFALTAAALWMRHDSGWHRRLHFCALACLMGPAFGRLLPLPLLIPHAFVAAALPGLLFPAWLAWREAREDGRLHPAWVVGLVALPLALLLAQVLSHSALGDRLYAAAVAGSPGAARPGLVFPPSPG